MRGKNLINSTVGFCSAIFNEPSKLFVARLPRFEKKKKKGEKKKKLELLKKSGFRE